MVLLGALTAAALLGAPPYVGVACPDANSIACDRVGVAVFVRTPASAVTATVAGREVRLARSWHDRRGRAWIGYLRPAGLRDGPLEVPADTRGRWYGREAPDVRVQVRMTRRDGTRAGAAVTVSLRPGWG